MWKPATAALFVALIACTPSWAQSSDAGGRAPRASSQATAIPDQTVSQPAGGRTGCSCTADAVPGTSPSTVWQGTERLTLADIAALAAPVLWFSADEPLLETASPNIPAGHPCDAPAVGPVVYYQAVRIAYRGAARVTSPVEDDPAFIDKVSRLVLRYFFYYPQDAGVGGHTHDLESIEIEAVIEGDKACHRVSLERFEGLAHGSRWYSNILEDRPDTKLPITVLVEEGKHGSAPDRNADGHFMRGYDVTARINDAWGVRDSLGQGVLLTAGYSPEMTKPRTDQYRLLPPENPRLCIAPRRSSIGDRPSLGRYTLRPAQKVKPCEVPAANRFLEEITKANKFGAAHEPLQFQSGDPRETLSRFDSPDQLLSVSLRKAGGRYGAAVVLRGLDLREGWLVPRLVVDEVSASAELMFTHSASRWFDSYFSMGVKRQFDTITETRAVDTEAGRVDVTFVQPPNWDGVMEAGVKFRANIPNKLRPFVLGYHFGGMRWGLRALGYPNVARWQVIWEIGAGAW